ncbi:hypothetical protein REPUB_Repub16aG0094500 [Reevesia pubescens]
MAHKIKNVEVEETCPICSNRPEDLFHALVSCPYAKCVWQLTSIGDISACVSTVGEWWQYISHKFKADDICIAAMISWGIWKDRNNLVWNDRKKSHFIIVAASKQRSLGYGCIIRDDQGGMIAAKNGLSTGIMDPLLAEAMSCREALSWLKDFHFNSHSGSCESY